MSPRETSDYVLHDTYAHFIVCTHAFEYARVQVALMMIFGVLIGYYVPSIADGLNDTEVVWSAPEFTSGMGACMHSFLDWRTSVASSCAQFGVESCTVL